MELDEMTDIDTCPVAGFLVVMFYSPLVAKLNTSVHKLINALIRC